MTTDKTRGVRNNNPGNIERVKGVRWQGELPLATQTKRDKRFVVFEGPQWGIRAICRVLITYQDKRDAADGSKIDSVSDIINRWAPPVENNTGAYARAVAGKMGVGINDYIDVYDWDVMRALVVAIIAHECGGHRYPDADIDGGLIKAGLRPPAKVVAAPTGATVLGAAGSVAASLGAAVSTAVVVAPGVVASLPAAKDSFDATVAALGPAGELVPWLPAVGGMVAAVAIVILALRNAQLRRRVA